MDISENLRRRLHFQSADARRQQKSRDKKRDRGLVPVQVWVKKEDRDKIYALAKKLTIKNRN